MKIYGDTKSGNCYKVQLVCNLLNIHHQWIDIDILAGDTKSDEFLKKHEWRPRPGPRSAMAILRAV